MRAPVFFIGHGSPMNALADNAYTKTLNALGRSYPNPKAILSISAHWMTEGSWVTAMEKPKTIHDFYGFPEALFEVQYPAPGDPAMASHIASVVKDPAVHLDEETWGLDHGTWSVLRHMYPEAEIPVLQLSLYMEQPPEYHFMLGQELRKLRDEGVLIVGSGNVVHNLRCIDWETYAKPFDWAVEYDRWIRDQLVARDFGRLVTAFRDSEAGKLSVPTTEHYLPLLYVIGASHEAEKVKFHFEELHNASISMRSFSFGA